jgi:hypothetical protein
MISEPYIFNLGLSTIHEVDLVALVLFAATLYELHSKTAVGRKTKLLIAAAKWNGDGLKTSVLKLG